MYCVEWSDHVNTSHTHRCAIIFWFIKVEQMAEHFNPLILYFQNEILDFWGFFVCMCVSV